MLFKRIKDLRIDHDYTQDDVAALLNVKCGVYRRYEVGSRDITIEVLIKLSKLYNVSTDYILGLTKDRE